MSKSMKALVLAGVLSLAAASAVHASGNSGASGGDVHASAAPVCHAETCPVVAVDGGPSTAGDHNGRAEFTMDTHRMLAGGRGGMTGEFHAKRSTQQRLAGGRTGIGGEVYLQLETHHLFAGGRGGMTGDTGNDRIAAVTDTSDWHPMLAASKPTNTGDGR